MGYRGSQRVGYNLETKPGVPLYMRNFFPTAFKILSLCLTLDSFVIVCLNRRSS